MPTYFNQTYINQTYINQTYIFHDQWGVFLALSCQSFILYCLNRAFLLNEFSTVTIDARIAKCMSFIWPKTTIIATISLHDALNQCILSIWWSLSNIHNITLSQFHIKLKKMRLAYQVLVVRSVRVAASEEKCMNFIEKKG